MFLVPLSPLLQPQSTRHNQFFSPLSLSPQKLSLQKKKIHHLLHLSLSRSLLRFLGRSRVSRPVLGFLSPGNASTSLALATADPPMYGHSHPHAQPMTMPNQIDDDDDASAGVGAAGAESVDNPHIRYDAPHALDDAGGGVAGGGVVDDVGHESVYAGAGHELAVHRGDGSSQLTLSFRGQVYVFDAVTPDKVQAVLLLLGGCEISPGAQGVGIPTQNHRTVVDIPLRCSQPQRAASLNRFRQKRKERCFDKKVRYSVRQEVALRMQRNKGQFTSKKSEGAYGWGNSQESGQDDNSLETLCTHCGISSKSTPMMRRGPSGPRSLCNACGLFWANRGTLRDLSKKTQDQTSTLAEQGEGEASDSNCETTIQTHNNNLVNFSNGDSSALMAEQ